MKTCSNCLLSKPEKDFSLKKANKDSLNNWCKTCCSENACDWQIRNKTRSDNNKKIWRDANPDRLKNSKLKSRYGISLENYNQMFGEQNGRCKICKKEQKTLRVDHDHATGKIRGLLCHKCNILLGNACDSVENLTNAINYLKNS